MTNYPALALAGVFTFLAGRLSAPAHPLWLLLLIVVVAINGWLMVCNVDLKPQIRINAVLVAVACITWAVVALI